MMMIEFFLFHLSYNLIGFGERERKKKNMIIIDNKMTSSSSSTANLYTRTHTHTMNMFLEFFMDPTKKKKSIEMIPYRRPNGCGKRTEFFSFFH